MSTLVARIRPTPLTLAVLVLLVTAAMEASTAALRFGAGLQSTRDTAFLAAWTVGIRIHHGYLGAALLLVSILARLPHRLRCIALVLGAGLLLSDLVHHFLVLWPITGSPAFDLTYPAR